MNLLIRCTAVPYSQMPNLPTIERRRCNEKVKLVKMYFIYNQSKVLNFTNAASSFERSRSRQVPRCFFAVSALFFWMCGHFIRQPIKIHLNFMIIIYMMYN